MLIFALILAFLMAKLEIEIEGEHAWGANLPTKKYKNRLTKLVWGEVYITGYHLWLSGLILTFLQLPFVVGVPWSLYLELQLLAILFLATILEDFFWFLLNPKFGIKKFNKKDATWHNPWFLGMPLWYVKTALLSGGLFFLSFLVQFPK